MKTSQSGLDLIAKYEGIRLKAYKCSAGVWTIGVGSTRYEDGSPVQAGDVLPSEAAAYKLFANTLGQYERAVSKLSGLSQNQFDALVSLCYNIGVGAFGRSTAFRLASANPDDPAIREAICRFNKSKGKVEKGLILRRKAEADMYFG